MTGKNDKWRLIDLNTVAEVAIRRLNKTECRNDDFLTTLLEFHVFTGCDTTSTFARRGEIKPLVLMSKIEP